MRFFSFLLVHKSAGYYVTKDETRAKSAKFIHGIFLSITAI